MSRATYAPINVNSVGGGGGECGQGAGIWCLRLSPCRAFDRAKRPRGRDIWLWPTEAWYQFRSGYQVRPSSRLKVTLSEKGTKFSFVLIAIIWYFKLSSKQIMSIFRKFLSSSSHLIVKLDWNRVLQYYSIVCLDFFPLGWELFWHFWLTVRFPPWGIWSKNFKIC